MYIDFNMNAEIRAEGFCQGTHPRIQQMRKDMKLDVEEFIRQRSAPPRH